MVAGLVRTKIKFGFDELTLAEETISASLGWHPEGSSVSLEGALGAVVHGSLGNVDLQPSAIFSLTGSWLPLTETAARPFFLLALTASALTGPQINALDLRLSTVVGKTLFDRLTLYGVFRLFGGPVNFDPEPATGSDTNHYAVALGATLRLPNAFDVFVEGAPLGEQSLNVGAGLRF